MAELTDTTQNGAHLRYAVSTKQASVPIASAVLPLLLVAYFTVPTGSALRDILYAFPFLLAVELLARSKGRIWFEPKLIALMGAFAVWQASKVLLRGEAFNTTLTEITFIGLSVIAFVPAYVTSRLLPVYLLAAGAANVLAIGSFHGFGSPTVTLTSSEGFSETGMGLILPFLAALALLRRRWLELLAALVLSFLMYKRIGLISGSLTIIYMTLFYNSQKYRGLIAFAFILTILITSLFSHAIMSNLSIIVLDAFNLHINTNQLSMGRLAGTEILLQALSQSHVWEFLVGHGAGFVGHVISQSPTLYDNNFRLLHNDWLRIYVDYGAIGLAAVVFVFWKAMSSKTPWIAAAALYTAILFMTDNVATYSAYWFALAFVLRSACLHYSPKVSVDR